MINALLNHLWQSSMFAVAMATLCWAMRRQAARLRYRLWFAASVKFLLPFSLLIGLAGHLAPRAEIVSPTARVILPTVSQVLEPFNVRSTTSAASRLIVQAAGPANRVAADLSALAPDYAPELALGIWAAGAGLLLIRWCTRWLRLRRAIRTSTPLPIAAPIPVRSSPTRIEPGVVGIVRPILLLPQDLETQLEPAQLQAIVLHEVTHVRRRDNLTAAVHMLGEVLFWFFPPLWWIGSRLVRERENACDEAVIAAGITPESYSEAIVRVCRLYLQLPLACAAGVAGADLKTRIAAIFAPQPPRTLSRLNALAVGLGTSLALLVPTILGVLVASNAQAQTSLRIPARDVQLTQSLLRAQRYDELDERMTAFQQRYEAGTLDGFSLVLEFNAFALPQPALQPNFDAWVDTHPNSYAARVGRGFYYFASGLQTRGTMFTANTTREQLRGMHLYLDRANEDLQASLALDAKAVVSYNLLIRIAMEYGDHDAARQALETALSFDPAGFVVRRPYLRSLQTRWGGSVEQMVDFLQASSNVGLSDAELADLRQLVDAERNWLVNRHGGPEQSAVDAG